MAQIEQPVLSICIPIYNRLSYLERMLDRFLEEKELFDSKIELFISDNCSEDDLQACCERFSQMGLRMKYHRNGTNLGMDGNFINCFNSAEGDYVWLLGSDDIPKRGYLEKICRILVDNPNQYGLLHLAGETPQKEESLFEVDNSDFFLEELHVWITFISGNIVKKEIVKTVDFDKYRGTLISQVPLYIQAVICSPINAIYYAKVFEKGSDSANNGGYNLFQVFVANLLNIFYEYSEKGFVSNKSIDVIKRREYKDFLVKYIAKLLLRRNGNFDTNNALNILWKYYGKKPYAYKYLSEKLLSILVQRCRNLL